MSKLAIDENKYEEISNLYKNGISIEKLTKLYNVSNSAIKTVLRKTNTKIRDHSHKGRKYYIDEDYFENIDTPNKAYVLGLLYSDGSVSNDNNNIRIMLQEGDEDILYKIIKDMNSNYPLRFHNLNSKNKNHKNAYELTISSKKMASDLRSLGVIQNKSLYSTFPDFLDKNLYRDFIRGVLDGDGHIEWNKIRFVNICATKSFCYGLQKFINNELDIKTSIYDTLNDNTKVIYIFKIERIIKFLTYLYDNSELYINRKYDKYIEIAKEINESLIA